MLVLCQQKGWEGSHMGCCAHRYTYPLSWYTLDKMSKSTVASLTQTPKTWHKTILCSLFTHLRLTAGILSSLPSVGSIDSPPLYVPEVVFKSSPVFIVTSILSFATRVCALHKIVNSSLLSLSTAILYALGQHTNSIIEWRQSWAKPAICTLSNVCMQHITWTECYCCQQSTLGWHAVLFLSVFFILGSLSAQRLAPRYFAEHVASCHAELSGKYKSTPISPDFLLSLPTQVDSQVQPGVHMEEVESQFNQEMVRN